MKLKFLGHGGAFSGLSDGNTNGCITIGDKNLLIDFGMCSNFIWREKSEWGRSYNDIDSIYISHCHFLDHCSIEPFLFHRYFIPKIDKLGNLVKPQLFAAPVVLKEIWEGLKPSMGVYRNEIFHLTNFAECHACSDFVFEKVRFKLIKNDHIRSSFGDKDAYGLIWEVNGKKIYWSSDSSNINLKWIRWADVVFHDCETLKGIKSGVHAHYLDLRKLPPELKAKMWLYHYSPNNLYPDKDGFAGFVVKGQEFDF